LVLNFAELTPWDLFFLHFVWDKASVSVFEGDFFYGIASKEAGERNQVTNGEVFDFGTVIQTKNGVATGTKGKENDSTGPDINS